MAWTSGTLDASCGTFFPPTCYNPPRAVLDVRSIGIPSNAPMFNQYTWATEGACVTSCDTTTSTGLWTTVTGTYTPLTYTASTSDIPLTHTFGTAGANNLTLDIGTGGTILPGYRVKPLRL